MRIERGLATPEYRRLGALSARELEAIMRRGETPKMEALAGWEFRGLNATRWSSWVGIHKFIKGFYRDAQGRVYGYNVPVVQNREDEPWVAKPTDARPKRFGFFRVDAVDPTSKDNAFLNAVILDYSRGTNPIWDPTNTIRDYVVRVERGSDELLLGKAYVAAGPVRVPVSYFLLERHRPTDYRR